MKLLTTAIFLIVSLVMMNSSFAQSDDDLTAAIENLSKKTACSAGPIPDALPSTIPDALPSTIPDALPSTIPDALPSTIPDALC